MAATITTPDQMAECHREQVVEEKSGPRQLGESLQGLAHPFEDAWPRRNRARGMKYLWAIEGSKPAVTKAVIGG